MVLVRQRVTGYRATAALGIVAVSLAGGMAAGCGSGQPAPTTSTVSGAAPPSGGDPEDTAPTEPEPEPSLGSSLIASGLVRGHAVSRPDPFAAIRRMSQAEKIALFS